MRLDGQHPDNTFILAQLGTQHVERANMNGSCVIVIPFVSMNEYLLQCLIECQALDYPHFHIVLLPDQPVSLPPEFLHDNISIIVTGDLTIAAKRNIAIRHFSGADYFALIDSDAYPDVNWLKNGVAYLANHPDVWAVGGPNITPPDEPLLQRVVGNAQQTFLVSGPLHFAKKLSASRDCSSLHSCNLILFRHAFDTLGGFDETLFTGEDRNLCDRIRETGKRIYFHRDVIVYHHNRSLWIPFLLQRITYGHGSVAIGKRQFNRFNVALYLPLGWLGLFLALFVYEMCSAGSMLASMIFAFINLAVAAVMAAQACISIREIPLTLAAILLCYLGTTIGQILALVGIEPNLKRFYSNRPAGVIPLVVRQQKGPAGEPPS